MDEQELHRLIMFFQRFPGEWWITGKTLINWIKYRELKFFDTPGIAVNCDQKTFKNYMLNYGWYGSDSITIGAHRIKLRFMTATELIFAPTSEIELNKRNQSLTQSGLWKSNIKPESPYYVQIPYQFGTLLDEEEPLWWIRKDKSEFIPKNKEIWLVGTRVEHGLELLQCILNCGKRAGIDSAMYLGFGNLLGFVTTGTFLVHDNDMDICIDSERTTKEGDLRYLEEIRKPMKIGNRSFPNGLCEKMFRVSNNRDDTGRPLWISLGHRSITDDYGIKCCHWWWFNHSNYSWHSKGDRWITQGKFNSSQVNSSDKAMALGTPDWILNDLIEVDFNGVMINMPRNVGSALDWWYPGWCNLGKKCSSDKKVILAIPDWNKKQTWRIL